MPPEFQLQDDLGYINFYLESLEGRDNRKRLFETKLLIVGKGNVGKTTLMKTLRNPKFDVEMGKEETTHGINIASFDKNIMFPSKKPFYNKFEDFDSLCSVVREGLELEYAPIFIPIKQQKYLLPGEGSYDDFLVELRLSDEPYDPFFDNYYNFSKNVKINICQSGNSAIKVVKPG